MLIFECYALTSTIHVWTKFFSIVNLSHPNVYLSNIQFHVYMLFGYGTNVRMFEFFFQTCKISNDETFRIEWASARLTFKCNFFTFECIFCDGTKLLQKFLKFKSLHLMSKCIAIKWQQILRLNGFRLCQHLNVKILHLKIHSMMVLNCHKNLSFKCNK